MSALPNSVILSEVRRSRSERRAQSKACPELVEGDPYLRRDSDLKGPCTRTKIH